MKTKLEYSGGGQIRVHLKNGTIRKINPGDTVKRGDIPNDAFDGFSVRPDFGASLDEYRASRVPSAPKPNPEPAKPKAELKAEPTPKPKPKKTAPVKE